MIEQDKCSSLNPPRISNMVLLIGSACNTVYHYPRLFIIGFVLLVLSFVIISSYTTSQVVAQTSEPTSRSTTATGLPTIQIIRPQDGQQVPPGAITIQGISSDDEETDCQVYADVNDITPMRNVTAAGPSGEEDDFSKWTFKYVHDYQLIKPGENELTAKISCYDDVESDLNPFPATVGTTSSGSPLSEWHTVNVTAVQGAAYPPLSPSPSTTEGVSDEESEEESSGDTGGDVNDDDGSNDDSTGGDEGNSNNSGDSIFD